jgi:hypothetical protein
VCALGTKPTYARVHKTFAGRFFARYLVKNDLAAFTDTLPVGFSRARTAEDDAGSLHRRFTALHE